jgi:hypothetical protein
MKVGSYRIQPNWPEIKLWGGLIGTSTLVVGTSYATGYALDRYTQASVMTGALSQPVAYMFAGVVTLCALALGVALAWMIVTDLFEIEEVSADD